VTCIVGIEHDGHVYIGGDSAGTAGTSQIIRADEKVFINDGAIMGFTSSFRMGQLLRYALTIPEQSTKKGDMKFLVTDFIDAVRALMKDKGWLEKDKERESIGAFLLGYRGKLYAIWNDLQVECVTTGYNAVGCGMDLALGSLHSTQTWADPEARIRAALEAAEAYSAGVRRPFVILKSP
jgi:ATP-dependent protease HslVU (ClpYQ) peptidase subunit